MSFATRLQRGFIRLASSYGSCTPVQTSAVERACIFGALALSALIQTNAAIFHHGAVGQDYGIHIRAISDAATDFSRAFAFRLTNPPLFYVIYAYLMRITGNIHFIEVVGLFNMVLNTAAIWLLYQLLRRSVASTWLRCAAVILVALLPARVVHTTVLAADALTVLPMLGAVWCLNRIHCAETDSRRLSHAFGLGAVLSAAVYVKYSFISALPATALLIFQHFRRVKATRRYILAVVGASVGVPVLAMATILPQFRAFREQAFAEGQGFELRSFAPKPEDIALLKAPSYWDRDRDNPLEDKHFILVQNRFSYPGLLHLGLWTDVKDIFEPKNPTEWFGHRTPRTQKAMADAVKLGLPISIAVFALVAAGIFGHALSGMQKPATTDVISEALLVYSLASYVMVVASLHFIPLAYEFGYWLPRLVLGPIVGFVAVACISLDRVIGGQRLVGVTLMSYITVISVLQVRFLWPWY